MDKFVCAVIFSRVNSVRSIHPEHYLVPNLRICLQALNTSVAILAWHPFATDDTLNESIIKLTQEI
jgi:hypothetical protein